MAKIKAFRGIRYNEARFGAEIEALVAPPYDVIDAEEQDELYARHPNNIVRLDLNREQDSDHAENNRYTRARRHLMDWLARGVLRVDDAPSIYVHHQTFSDGRGGQVTRRGFISLVGLAEYEEGIILPHERTLRGPKVDRLELMKATECNLSQIFMLYDDPESMIDNLLEDAIAESDPVVDITTPDEISHRLWVVQDEALLTKIEQFFAEQSLLIADGHHRYETALAYREFRRGVAEEEVVDPLYDNVVTFLVNMRDPGLAVFPTHRVVHGVEDFDGPALLEKIAASEHFDVRALAAQDPRDGEGLIATCEEAGEKHPSFILIAEGVDHPHLVQFVGDVDAPLFDEETPSQVRALDVAVLHEGIIDRMLGISKDAQEAKTNLRYKKKLGEAIAELDDPSTQLLVIMNATPVEQVDEVCRSGGKMPQKSTYFYPKILSGLVVNPL